MEVSKPTILNVMKAVFAVLFAAMVTLALAAVVQPVQQAHAENSQTMYRLYNPNSGEHFFTASTKERDNLVSLGWKYEGEGWTAPTMGTPVYRLYNPNQGEHHYTPSVNERDSVVAAGWKYEGVGWYADPANNLPMYRVYNPNELANNHHYTSSTKERNDLVKAGWKDEGIGWYGVSKGDYFATIDIKDYGTIVVSLNDGAAPKTVANFVKLANNGFYDGLTFHRIIAGFMMQGGDPWGTGAGGSDENVVGEFADNGFNNPISHTRGAISMARSNDYNSATSQFFIVHQDSSKSLDKHYAAFGHVMSGIEVVDKVCTSARPTDNNGSIPASAQPVIKTVKIGKF